jgi:hypothetical protein
MKQLRLMFPDFFDDPPAAPPLWGTLDSMNPYPAFDGNFDQFQHVEQNHMDLSL